jgi:hypothetical protein
MHTRVDLATTCYPVRQLKYETVAVRVRFNAAHGIGLMLFVRNAHFCADDGLDGMFG